MSTSSPVVAPLAKSSNTLAFELYGQLASEPGNLAMSPASIEIALAMTWGGANAHTADEMRRVLHLEGDVDVVGAGFGKLATALQDPARPLKLRIANRLFGEKTFTFQQPFIDRTRTAFGAPFEPVDFKVGFDDARKAINRWVEDQTEKRIKDLLPEESLTSETRLVLVNAIYFLADWAEPFDKAGTFEQPFNVTPTTQVKAQMMHDRKTLPFAKVDGAKLVELPYKGGDTAMWIVLPDAIDGLPAIEKSLDAAKLVAWKGKTLTQDVVIALPRFEVNPAKPVELKKHLQALGMVDAFSDSAADLSGIGVPPDPAKRLYIAAVFHKAFVKVDEKGTEAAAATAVVGAEGGGMPPKAESFTADHPFLFFIVDKPSGLILFMGRVAAPA